MVGKKGQHWIKESGTKKRIREPLTLTQTVTVLALAHSCHFRRGLLFSTGTGNKRQIMNISSMADKLGASLTMSLIGFHTISGCDSTSSFYGYGKASVLKLDTNDVESCRSLTGFGDTWDPTQQLHDSIVRFVCMLYGQPNADSFTEARYTLFCNKTSSEKSIPPTRPALHQHTHSEQTIKRVSGSLPLNPCMSAREPFGRGWSKEDDGIFAPVVPRWSHC